MLISRLQAEALMIGPQLAALRAAAAAQEGHTAPDFVLYFIAKPHSSLSLMQLISRQEAEALMTGPPPSSPQSSSGSPGTPQHMSKPSHDFPRTGVTLQEDIKPLIANPGDVLSGQYLLNDVLSGQYLLNDVLSGQYLLNTDRMCLSVFPSLQQIGALSLHANLRINSAMSSQPKCIALPHIKGCEPPCDMPYAVPAGCSFLTTIRRPCIYASGRHVVVMFRKQHLSIIRCCTAHFYSAQHTPAYYAEDIMNCTPWLWTHIATREGQNCAMATPQRASARHYATDSALGHMSRRLRQCACITHAPGLPGLTQFPVGAHIDAGRPDQRDGRLSASDYEALRIGQDCRPLPHVEASEAARMFHAAKPRARMAQVLEGTPMPLPAPTTAEQGWQTPQKDEGTRQYLHQAAGQTTSCEATVVLEEGLVPPFLAPAPIHREGLNSEREGV